MTSEKAAFPTFAKQSFKVTGDYAWGRKDTNWHSDLSVSVQQMVKKEMIATCKCIRVYLLLCVIFVFWPLIITGKWDGQLSPVKVSLRQCHLHPNCNIRSQCRRDDSLEPEESRSFYESGIILAVCIHCRVRGFGSWSMTLAPSLHCAEGDMSI